MRLCARQMRLFRRIQRRYPVSTAFINRNMRSIEKFLWYATCPRAIIKRMALRKGRGQRVVIDYHQLRRVLFDRSFRKMIKTRKRNVKQWSRNVVYHLRKTNGVKEFVEKTVYGESSVDDEESRDCHGNVELSTAAREELSKQLKETLELLNSGKRSVALIEATSKKARTVREKFFEPESSVLDGQEAAAERSDAIRVVLENTPEKQKLLGEPASFLDTLMAKSLATSTEKHTDEDVELEEPSSVPNTTRIEGAKLASADTQSKTNFLDMLFNKVQINRTSIESELPSTSKRSTFDAATLSSSICEHSTDSCEDFLGFDESERVPGMLMTPLVPQRTKMKPEENTAFVSESLDEYMRENLLETSVEPDISERKHRQATLDGLVTPTCTPPQMEMPIVPESLQKLRTVAERRQYLQKFSKNHKLVIINNEAMIYRELQRKIRISKSKSVAQQQHQDPNSQMPFTRRGWQAASFVTTEFNKYYYQMLDVDNGRERIKLPGVRGNNDEFNKPHYSSRLPYAANVTAECFATCCDLRTWRDFKPINTFSNKKKLNKGPLPAIFKPCPLSHKPFQKLLDDETAALLLAGGSMAVVRMPTVELEVFPEVGKPLHEIAKRYLQYILPHHDISREWAEFSVSTLQQPRSMKEAEAAMASSLREADGRCKSFTFAIPYLNDRNHILVRRVVDRSEKLDESFKLAKESKANLLTDLSFRANLDETDTSLMECADVLSDMINSVAISCSENSFIKEDPDGLRVKNKKQISASTEDVKTAKPEITSTSEDKVENKAEIKADPKSQKKQNRLLCELRRLNATIIDAAVKSGKEAKPCSKAYCALGCVCSSLINDYPLRQHCGKSKCVIECTCKGSNQSRFMRLETDGRTITTEDAFMLRRQATARLARMEKEFTSTIVLTENETLLINESQYDKKRRCTKAPKRYEDFADAEDDFSRTSPKKSGGVVAIEPNEPMNSNLIAELREPVFVKDTVLDQLKHCTVPLMQLENIKNMATWCMVHELYKCFCGGRALEGKPLMIEMEDAHATTTHGTGELEYVLTGSKARYSFEKEERNVTDDRADVEKVEKVSKSSKKTNQEDEEDSEDNNACIANDSYAISDSSGSNSDQEWNKKPRKSLADPTASTKHKRGRPTDAHIFENYCNTKPTGCRRVVALPLDYYLRRNRKRVPQVNEYIHEHENTKTRLLLNEHILRSVYYHKYELEKERKKMEEPKKQSKKVEQPKKQTPLEEIKPKSVVAESVVDLIDEDSHQSSVISSVASSQKSKHRRGRKRKLINSDSKQSASPVAGLMPNESIDLPDETETESVAASSTISSQTAQSAPSDVLVPKIASCFSLNDNVNPAQSLLPPSSLSTDIAAQLDNDASQCVSERDATTTAVYNTVIKNINNLVSKKMQDIETALKRESKVIPPPNEEILCIIKWTNFLDAFIDGFVYIWQVEMPANHTFFAATITNMMPMVLGAMGVVNIAALSPGQLPLMCRMLLQRNREENTLNLAIVMQGRMKYWLVKGFLRPDKQSACSRPTPKTHPLLTRKINVLFNLLVKQRVKEYNRKLHQSQSSEAQAIKEKRSEERPKTPQQVAAVATIARMPLPDVPTLGQMQSPQKITVVHSTPPVPPLSRVSPVETTILPNSLPKPSVLKKKTTTSPSNMSVAAKRAKLSSSNAELLQNLTSQQEYANMKTNIEFRKVVKEDIDEIHQPECHAEDHRWLVLDLYNDFSHIFVPDFRDLVSLDRIHKVMAFSHLKKKIVKLQFFQNAPYDAFVTPSSSRKIYFGPLKLNMRPPLLILLQSVDGRMMLREIYQQEHNIQCRPKERTTAFWIMQINGQIHFEIDEETAYRATEPNNERVLQSVELASQAGGEEHATTSDKEDSDDDCMIVEDQSEDNSEEFGVLVPQKASKTTTIPQEGQEKVAGAGTLAERFNFTIQTVDNSNQLKITAVSSDSAEPVSQAVSLNAPAQFVPICLPPSGPLYQLPYHIPTNAFISGAKPAPDEAQYGSTIYISSNPTAGNGDDLLRVAQPNANAVEQTVTSAAPIEPTLTSTAEPPVKKMRLLNKCINAKKGTTSSIFLKMDAKSQLNPNDTDKVINPTFVQPPTPSSILNPKLMALLASTPPSAIATTPQTSTASTSQRVSASPSIPAFASPSCHITSPITTATTTTTIAQSIQSSGAPIAQRRISVRYPERADSLTKNMVIGAVLKLLPNNIELKKVADLPPVVEKETSSPSQSLAESINTGSVSTIGSTTITKVVDGKTTSENNVQPDELEPVAAPRAEKSASVSTATTLGKPMVFDVSFDDSQEEPSASIVIKPKRTAAGTEGSAEPLRSPLTAASIKAFNAYRAASAIRVLKTQATTGGSKVTENVVSPMSLGSTKNFRSVTSTPLNFNNAMVKAAITAGSSNAPTQSIFRKVPIHSVASDHPSRKVTGATQTQLVKLIQATHTAKSQQRSSLPPMKMTKIATTKTVFPPIMPSTKTAATATITSSQTAATATITSATAVPVATVAPTTTLNSASNVQTNKKPIFNVRPSLSGRRSLPTKLISTAPTTQRNVIDTKPTAIATSPKQANGSNAATVSKLVEATANGASKVEDSQFGFISCSVDGTPKFVAKRIKDNYMVKVPKLGVQKMLNLAQASAFLNQHLVKKDASLAKKLPTLWKFAAHPHLNAQAARRSMKKSSTMRTTQVQQGKEAQSSNHETASSASSPKLGQITPLTNSTKEITSPPMTYLQAMRKTMQAAVNATAIASENVHGDTILIDD